MDEDDKQTPANSRGGQAAGGQFVVGADISRLSEGEIMARITDLKAEIIRLEGALEQKQASRKAADSVFRF